MIILVIYILIWKFSTGFDWWGPYSVEFTAPCEFWITLVERSLFQSSTPFHTAIHLSQQVHSSVSLGDTWNVGWQTILKIFFLVQKNLPLIDTPLNLLQGFVRTHKGKQAQYTISGGHVSNEEIQSNLPDILLDLTIFDDKPLVLIKETLVWHTLREPSLCMKILSSMSNNTSLSLSSKNASACSPFTAWYSNSLHKSGEGTLEQTKNVFS